MIDFLVCLPYDNGTALLPGDMAAGSLLPARQAANGVTGTCSSRTIAQ